MYTSIRRYRSDATEHVNDLVREKFVPQVRELPGFVAYYGVDSGKGIWASVSVFETAEGAEESNRLAARFVEEHDLGPLIQKLDVTAGEVVASAAVVPMSG